MVVFKNYLFCIKVKSNDISVHISHTLT